MRIYEFIEYVAAIAKACNIRFVLEWYSQNNLEIMNYNLEIMNYLQGHPKTGSTQLNDKNLLRRFMVVSTFYSQNSPFVIFSWKTHNLVGKLTSHNV